MGRLDFFNFDFYCGTVYEKKVKTENQIKPRVHLIFGRPCTVENLGAGKKNCGLVERKLSVSRWKKLVARIVRKLCIRQWSEKKDTCKILLLPFSLHFIWKLYSVPYLTVFIKEDVR